MMRGHGHVFTLVGRLLSGVPGQTSEAVGLGTCRPATVRLWGPRNAVPRCRTRPSLASQPRGPQEGKPPPSVFYLCPFSAGLGPGMCVCVTCRWCVCACLHSSEIFLFIFLSLKANMILKTSILHWSPPLQAGMITGHNPLYRCSVFLPSQVTGLFGFNPFTLETHWRFWG